MDLSLLKRGKASKSSLGVMGGTESFRVGSHATTATTTLLAQAKSCSPDAPMKRLAHRYPEFRRYIEPSKFSSPAVHRGKVVNGIYRLLKEPVPLASAERGTNAGS